MRRGRVRRDVKGVNEVDIDQGHLIEEIVRGVRSG